MSPVPALFRYDRGFANAFPHHSVLPGPTPVQPLERLTSALGGPTVWVKRDDLSSPLYGGNKPRKLEFLLADAARRGARSLVTFGVIGSHHALATAIHARELGIDTTAVLVNGPLHRHAIENLRRTCVHARRTLHLELTYVPEVAAAVLPAWLGLAPDTYLIPPGGSSVVGNLGYVSAGLELAEQVRAGELPRPDFVYLPAGSLGTMAGLVAGFALAGLETWVVGIAVLPPPGATTDRVDRLVRKVRRHLIAAVPDVKRIGHGFERFSLRFGQLGAGYGHATASGLDAQRRLAELEGLTLDTTYTAKAMAGMIEHVTQPSFRGKNVLFWHTLSSSPPTESAATLAAARIPASLVSRVARAEADALAAR
ncbi:MAG: pyridoxal-phosphate dependent enzyme [Deltaproteobacteria bacterium]|nr:pyridoxal-phosphate dependent enzyme [Deltaproteobacteria bacterium]